MLDQQTTEASESRGDGIRHDWRLEEIERIYTAPLIDLLLEAQRVHRRFHAPNQVQASVLLNIKSGGCPEDCAYCPQSA
ncbi:MAG: biotin synthase, partial [Vicinamibacterales bacterium]